MTYELRFQPQVVEDVASAVEWYENRRDNLGNEFLKSYYATLDLIVSRPEVHTVVHSDIRRALLRKFPYAVFFGIEGRFIIIIMVHHCMRDPTGVKSALESRNT